MDAFNQEKNVIDIKLCKNATLPSKGSVGAAGFDLYAFLENQPSININVGDRKLISVGFQISLPKNCYARIAPRSGLSVMGIDIGAGVVDSDFRGTVHALVINNSKKIFTIKNNDRIAQMIIEKIIEPMLQQQNCLNTTERGDGGFGSTG